MKEKDCCKKFLDRIDKAFNEWVSAFETDETAGVASTTPGACPYSRRNPNEASWWKRGYAYQARLFRALKAEAKLTSPARAGAREGRGITIGE